MSESTDDPSLLPLPEVDWGELDSPAVEHLAFGRLRPPDWRDLLLERVLELGIGIEHDNQVAPTLAGVVAFGVQPQVHFDHGVDVVHGDKRTHLTGRLAHILRDVRKQPVVRDASMTEVVSLLVAHAFAHRRMVEATRMPSLLLGPSTLTVEYEPGPPMPTLFELLVARGFLGRKGLGLKRVVSRVGKKKLHLFEDQRVTRIVVDIELPPLAPKPSPRLAPRPPPRLNTNPVYSRPAVRTAPSRAERPPSTSPKRMSLSARAERVVVLVQRDSSATRRDLQVELGWGRSTLRDVLRHLVEVGRLSTMEDSRSPFQRYRMAK
jgi:hypothetical protein